MQANTADFAYSGSMLAVYESHGSYVFQQNI